MIGPTPAQPATRPATTKRGEILSFPTPTKQHPMPVIDLDLARDVVIRYGGREFTAKREMAAIFLAHVQATIEKGKTELIPLLHHGGIDLLLIHAGLPLDVRA